MAAGDDVIRRVRYGQYGLQLPSSNEFTDQKSEKNVKG